MLSTTISTKELSRIDETLAKYFPGVSRAERRTINVDLRVFSALKMYAGRRGWTLQMAVQHLISEGLTSEYKDQEIESLKLKVPPEEWGKIEQFVKDCSPGNLRIDRRTICVDQKIHTALKMSARRRGSTLQSVVHHLIIQGFGYELQKLAIENQKMKMKVAGLSSNAR